MNFDPVSYAMGKASGGGGSSVTVEALSVTENGTYTAPSGKAYSPVTVAVGGDPALPSEYQEVEYLTNDGDCWCEINFEIKKYDEANAEFSLSADATTSENGFAGYVNQWELMTGNNRVDSWGTYISGSPSQSITRDVKTTYAVIFESKPNAVWYWGRYKTNAYPFIGNLFSFELLRGIGAFKAKILKLVACYRKADNVPGFYDVINSVFYTNQGTGTFGIGPDV